MTNAYTIPSLKIVTLGQFAVWRGNERLPDKVWGRIKALRLFQYLLTNRRSFISRERIVADLWPELDEAKGDRDFKVALNALNSALQPDRAARSLSAYITRQGTSYGLNRDAPIELDVVQFESGILAGSQAERPFPLQSIIHYRNALNLYHGDYLPDTVYEDWTSAERERMSTLFLSSATRLARLLFQENETVEAVVWCQRVLEMDSCSEAAYRLLMQAHMVNGDRPLAIKTYQKCRSVLEEELGIEPMPETVDVYKKIVNG